MKSLKLFLATVAVLSCTSGISKAEETSTFTEGYRQQIQQEKNKEAKDKEDNIAERNRQHEAFLSISRRTDRMSKNLL